MPATVERGTTVRFRLTTKDFDDNIITPTATPTCKVFDQDNQFDPIATLTVETYGTGQYQAYWNIPTTLKVGPLPTQARTYYAEWAWTWAGKAFIDRVPFDVVHYESL